MRVFWLNLFEIEAGVPTFAAALPVASVYGKTLKPRRRISDCDFYNLAVALIFWRRRVWQKMPALFVLP